jgi:site-specific DNA-methyltransferase (adenine-specific)
MFRYSWVWEKEQGVNFLNAKNQPMKVHEDVQVFSKKKPPYYPQMTAGKPYISGAGDSGEVTGKVTKTRTKNTGTRYPRSIQLFKRETGLHPTQKPVSLFEYMVRTYTQPGETVLDFTMGSGTTGVACMNTGRNFIGIELDAGYFAAAADRIEKARLAALGIHLLADMPAPAGEVKTA